MALTFNWNKIRMKDLKEKAPIPVTLLSGFLGSGKTTLLTNLLTNSDGYKIAVIVNDMAAVNIDAHLISSNHKVTKKREKLIQLSNGCICCTLRGDLLEELIKLSKSDEYDYIIIESTGIGEPMQVAETFTTDFTQALLDSDANFKGGQEAQITESEIEILQEIIEAGGLNKFAKLDTCVTVLDSFNFLSNFETTDFLVDRYGSTGQNEEERTITDLMCDQIEFCDVLIMNKISSISKKNRKKIFKIIHSLNPIAKIIQTDYCDVKPEKVLNTGLYDFEKASTSAGWLQSINEMTIREGFYGEDNTHKLAPKPETEEYGINNFVYQSRRPFHPKRLYDMIRDKFFVIEQSPFQNEEGNMEDENDNEEEENEGEENEEEEESQNEELSQKEIVSNKKSSPFGPLLRSKGFFWLASRYLMRGEWSSAGTMLTLKGGIPWFGITSEEYWPQDPNAIRLIKRDFEGKHQDRRQELVFIGLDIDKQELKEAMDSCLLNDLELEKFNKICSTGNNLMKIERTLGQEFEDGFEDWFIFEDGEADAKDLGIKERSINYCHHNESKKANLESVTV